jgi:asparagine synthase (glutamine-hydrolysing)
MPGIVGIIGSGCHEKRSAELREMLASLHRESFYSHGSAECPDLGIWAGWTAHRGSFAERISTRAAPGNARLLLTGEFFPAAAGEVDSATVLVAFLDDWRRRGDRALAALNGLFSGVIVDPLTRQVALFNDRYGIERVYVHRHEEAIYFSSEAKAILAVAARCRAFDEIGVASYLKFGSVPAPSTLFRDIEVLSGATVITTNCDAPRERRYFEPSEWETLPVLSPSAFSEELAATLRARVPDYATAQGSDVGMAVTGGLDTRMILAALPERSGPMRTYTFSGIDGETLDERLGRQAAAVRGLEHQTLRIGRDFLVGFDHFVDRTVSISDATAGATSAHEVYLTALARSIAPIRLTGNFGSEVLRGMTTVKAKRITDGLLDPAMERLVARSAYGSGHSHPVTATAFAEVPWHLYGPLAVGRSQLSFRTPYMDNDVVSLAYRAPVAARSNGAASLHAVASLAPHLAIIPTDRGLVGGVGTLRSIPRRAYAALTFKLDYLDKEGLPGWMRAAEPALGLLRRSGLLGSHKYLAYRSWFRNEFQSYVRSITECSRVRQLGFWDASALQDLVAAHASGRRNGLYELNGVLTIEAASRLLFSRSARTPAAAAAATVRPV